MLSSKVWNSAGWAASTGAEKQRRHARSAIAAMLDAARMMQECAEPKDEAGRASQLTAAARRASCNKRSLKPYDKMIDS
jgi:hypothetical protein